MNTLIKGTFPVRFRRDGKDGVNVWLKYASVLDLYDSGTGKYYPSNNNIFNEPTAECKYIGIGKGVGDEPTQGQYYDWKKYIGDDGTSFTAKGQAIAHYTTLTAYNSASKSVGLYLVDNTGGALLKYWNGSASGDRSVTDGDAYTTADKHLWVKDGAKWNDLGEIQGPKGDPAYIDTVYLKGASYNSAGIPYAKVTITKNNTSRTYEATTRGLHAYKIDRTTLTVTKIGAYDTYIDTATANTLATEINKLDTTVFLAIVSFDACGFTSNFVTAIKQFGGNDIADLTAKRQAFCFLGYKGMAQGTALQVLNVGDAKISEISSIVSNGVCQGSGQGGNSILSVTNYYLAHSSSSTAPTGTWDTDPSKSGFSASKPYLWNYEVTTFSLSSAKSTTPRVIGVWSKDGKGIRSITEYYLATSASSGVTTSTSGWGTTVQPITATKKYLWNYEVITYTDSSTTTSTPCIIGVYGDKGDDAYSYKLRSNITAIPLDNNGMPVDSAKSLTLTGNIFKGSSSISVSTSYTIRAIITWNGTASDTKTSSNGSLTVDLSTYKNIVKVACSFLYGSTVLDSFDILPIKAGAAGVSYFPNMRGYWQAGSSYSWLNGSRDMVTYNKDGVAYLYAVKTAGTTVTTCPLSDAGTVNSGWEEAATPFSMLFANFVYTDNASVAGFIWSADKMKSSSGLLEIDGKNGTIKCSSVELTGTINATGGTIGEFVIRDKGLGLACKADEADISMTCQSNTKRNARIYVTPKYDNAVISASTDTTTAAEFTASQSSGTALSVIGKTNINGAVNIQGNVELSGTLSGLRLSATTMSSGGTISPSYDVICFNNTSAITVTLPSASTYKGRMLFLKKIGSGSVTLRGTIIPANGTGSTTTTDSVGANKSMMYISNGSAWIEYYCG